MHFPRSCRLLPPLCLVAILALPAAAAGLLTTYPNPNAGNKTWKLVLVTKLKAGKFTVTRASAVGASSNMGKPLVQVNDYGLIDAIGGNGTLDLDGLDKQDTAVEFRLVDPVDPKRAVLLRFNLRDGAKAHKPYKATIQSITPICVIPNTDQATKTFAPLQAAWPSVFSMADLDTGDLVIKAKDLSGLQPSSTR